MTAYPDEAVRNRALTNGARALVAGLSARAKLQRLGLADRPALRRWIFDVGESRLDQAVEQFRAELAVLGIQGA